MFLNNSFNILPWYDSLEKQSSKKWYAFGQSWPLLCPKGAILPFQFVCEALEVTSNIQAVNVSTNEITDLGVAPSVIQGSQPNSTYYVVKLASATVPALPVGTYYLRFNTSLGYLYSEEITIIDDSSECIKIQYWNEDTLNFASGEINFADGFKFEFYIRSTIGKPEYEFEEELTKRLGYKFIESQTSNKVYKFAFIAPEYICDAMRLIRLCDYVKLTTKFDSYNALSFAYEPKWQDQGDLAAVDVEFDTDCIIQKLESFNRRIKESFYNALLADIDEPVLFSTDTVAQYYTEFTTTSFINGKLIRQLESILPTELQSNFVDLVLPIDNMADDKNTAKKVSLSDLMSLVNSSDISKLFKGHFDADGNLQWIEALSHIGVNGGVTMFIDNGTMSLPQLYAGLPIDNNTLIRDDNGVLMINPDIDLGGGLTEVYWNDIKAKPTFATVATSGKYADLSGLPNLSVYATTEYLTAELKKYVTLNTEQPIAAHKNFLNGLSVGGLGITKSQDDVIYLDANLVVRGGITMYATDTVDVPSIIDSLPIASTSAKGLASFDPNFFSVDVNGNVSFIGSTGGVDESVLADYAKKTDLSAYLPLSGGQMTGGISCPIEYDGNITGLAASCVFYYDNSLTARGSIDNKRSLMGYAKNNTTGYWYNIISVRGDSSNYGMYITSSMNSNSQENLCWNRQIDSSGDWQGERVILDSSNWSNYIQVSGGGSFISTSGGTITNSGTGLYINRTMAGAVAHITFQVNGSNVGDLGVNSAGSPAFYSYGLNGISQGWKTLMYSEGSGYSLSNITIEQANWGNGLKLNRNAANAGAGISSYSQGSYLGTFGVNGMGQFEFSNKTDATAFIVKGNGDVLAYGGITMYSDLRKKTKLQDVELSLNQIANAPLIEHYYNSDTQKTTHVGSIAQYWAGLNDWFCKLDNEGFYTMEIQNAALASAISIARELTRYESKTDRKIRLLKQRVKELEDKIEKLENN